MASPSSTPLLAVRDVTMRFGGIVALDSVSFEMRSRADRRPHRPERGRQDDAVQLREPPLHSRRRAICCSRAPPSSTTRPHHVAALGIGRTFQNLALFPTMSVAAERDGRRPRQDAQRFPEQRAPAPVGRARGARGCGKRRCEMLAFLELDAVADHPAAGLPFGTLKRVELARALAGRPEAPARRRAGRRPQPRGGGRARRHPPRHPGSARRDGPPRGASHEPRDAGVRPGRGARLRPEDRRRPARGRPAEPGRDQGLPRARD